MTDFKHMKSVRGRPLVERFTEKFKVAASGCWEWVGSKNANGYGQLMIDKRPIVAHRVSWRLNRGAIPAGMFVCHHCDNPACVNPEHLFLGTNADNMADMRRKGRANDAARGMPGQHNPHAKLTAAQAAAIRASKAPTKALTSQFGVCRTTIQRIRRGNAWM